MSLSSTAMLFQLPSVQRFVTTLAGELADRRSLVVLLPVGIDPADIWTALQAELWRRDLACETISLPDVPAGRAPVVTLGEALRIHWSPADTPRTIANLLGHGELPDIIQLEGLDQLSDAAREAWMDFLLQWVQACQHMVDHGRQPTVLCLVMPALPVLAHIPEGSVHLAVHWWWRLPSALEMRLLCRLGTPGQRWDARARWQEYVLPALAGSDLAVADHLWNDPYMDLRALLHRLQAFAAQRGWATETLRNWGAIELQSAGRYDHNAPRLAPPQLWRTLWAHGALGATIEYGQELHPAALAVLGRDEELQHRLWRGQSEILLPSIDQIRLHLCDHLTRAYGHDWPVRWRLPVSPEEELAVRGSPLACQWGHLEVLLKYCTPLRAERHWLPVASLARWIRNEIAHYRAITFRDFEGLWREVAHIDLLATWFI
jgi:hypothetical protein